MYGGVIVTQIFVSRLGAISQSSAVGGLKAYENKAQGVSPVATDRAGYTI